MNPAVTTPLERHLYAALKRIAAYQPPDKLRRHSEKTYGLDGDEAIEAAYENVLSDARIATAGLWLAKAPTSPPSSNTQEPSNG